MQAMNGFALLRSRTRVIGVLMGVALAVAALTMAFVSNASAEEPPQKNYLALGDSLAFDYSQELFNENWPQEDPKRFEEAAPKGSGTPNGYTVDLFNKLKAGQMPTSQWTKLINNGCPGETTDGFIGNGPLRAELEAKGFPIKTNPASWIAPTVTTSPCAYHSATKYHLHHEYGGNHSQLENALEVLRKENTGGNLTKHPVTLLTLDIGANDILRAVAKCQAEVKFEYEHTGDSKYNHPPYAEEAHEGHSPKDAVVFCARFHTGEIFFHIFRNVVAIQDSIRSGGGLGLCVGAKAPCDASHKAINYTGKYSFLGTYDAFGSVFEETSNACQHEPAPAPCNRELLEGSIVQAAILNIDMREIVEEAGGTYTNPEPNFNPAIVEMPQFEWGEGPPNPGPTPGLWPRGGTSKGAPFNISPLGTLQKWTNMANFSYARATLTRSDGSAEVTEGSNIVKNIKGLNNGIKSATELKSAVVNGPKNEQPDEVEGGKIPAAVNPFNPSESPATTPTGTKIVKVISATEVELSKPVEGTEGKTIKEQISFRRANGPLDIHPTPVGYEQLANEMLPNL